MLLHPDYRSYIFAINTVYRELWKASGELPRWFPFHLCGVSAITNVPFYFSISRLLTLAGVPPVLSVALSEYAFMVVGAFSFQRLLRIYGATSEGALAAAGIFSYLYAKVPITEGCPMALAPAVLLAVEAYAAERRFVYLAAGCLFVGIVCSTGIVHGVMFVGLFHVLLSTYRAFRGEPRHLLGSAVIWVVGALLSLHTLLPQVRDAAQSQRLSFKPFAAVAASLSFSGVIDQSRSALGLRDYFGPFFVLAVPWIVLWAGRPKLDARIRALLFATGVVAAVQIGLWFTQGYWGTVPWIGKLVIALDLNRSTYVVAFCLVFLAALMADGLVAGEPLRWKRHVACAAAGVAIVLSVAFALPPFPVRMGLVLGGFVVAAIYLKPIGRRAAALVFLAGLAYAGWKDLGTTYAWELHLVKVRGRFSAARYLSPSAYDQYFESTMNPVPDEAEAHAALMLAKLRGSADGSGPRAVDLSGPKVNYDEVRLMANRIPTLYGIANIYPARLRDYYLWTIDDLRVRNPANFRTFETWPTHVFGLGSRFNETLLSIAGVGWVLAPAGQHDDRFPAAVSGKAWTVLSNPKALPRAFAVFETKVLADKDAVGEFLKNQSLDVLRRIVPISTADARGFSLSPSSALEGKVVVRHYGANAVDLEAELPSDGAVVLTDNFHDTWRASVDGVPARVFPAYHAFRMVPVPKGSHRIRFFHHDALFSAGRLMAAGTLLIIGLAVVADEARRKSRRAVAPKIQDFVV
ncbi:MAG: hypothetical protein HY078_05775 [Elusimicrobia bacterium]|nr:hypothetical protein [Elusimicrobiota bacterium]